MKKWSAMLFTLLLLESLGSGFGDFFGKTTNAVIPHSSEKVSSDRAMAWAQHDAEHAIGNDPTGMALSG